jgi:hypothetical protein
MSLTIDTATRAAIPDALFMASSPCRFCPLTGDDRTGGKGHAEQLDLAAARAGGGDADDDALDLDRLAGRELARVA